MCATTVETEESNHREIRVTVRFTVHSRGLKLAGDILCGGVGVSRVCLKSEVLYVTRGMRKCGSPRQHLADATGCS